MGALVKHHIPPSSMIYRLQYIKVGDKRIFPSYYFHILPPPLGVPQYCLSLPLPAEVSLSQPPGLNLEQFLEDVIWHSNVLCKKHVCLSRQRGSAVLYSNTTGETKKTIKFLLKIFHLVKKIEHTKKVESYRKMSSILGADGHSCRMCVY